MPQVTSLLQAFLIVWRYVFWTKLWCTLIPSGLSTTLLHTMMLIVHMTCKHAVHWCAPTKMESHFGKTFQISVSFFLCIPYILQPTACAHCKRSHAGESQRLACWTSQALAPLQLPQASMMDASSTDHWGSTSQ